MGEKCDDRNTLNGDGCSSTCQLEASHRLIPDMPLFVSSWFILFELFANSLRAMVTSIFVGMECLTILRVVMTETGPLPSSYKLTRLGACRFESRFFHE